MVAKEQGSYITLDQLNDPSVRELLQRVDVTFAERKTRRSDTSGNKKLLPASLLGR